MDQQQQPYGSGEVPPQGPQEGQAPGYNPPQDPYSSPYQRPTTDQPIQSNYPRTRTPFARLFTTDKIVLFIVLGLFFMFIGAVIITAVSTSDGPRDFDAKYDDDDDGFIDTDKRDNYLEDQRTYWALKDIGTILGRIIISFGMLMTVVALLGGGITNQELDKYVRIGMIIAAGLIIGWSGFI
jgi:hypothetical protein